MTTIDGEHGDQLDDDKTPPEATPFGEWLLRVRSESGFSRQELSDNSRVSVMQIWNIETGKTANPRQGTRDRLSEALGSGPPEPTVGAAQPEADIPEVGVLTDFDPHDRNDLPGEPGIYVFYDVSDRPIYVGQSADIGRRIRSQDGHVDKFWFRSPIVETAAYVRIDSETLRMQVEQTMIRFLKSNAVVNKRHVAR